jgi:hypothetical protein
MEHGKSKHQLKLNTAGAEEASDVLSEGQQRALVIATSCPMFRWWPTRGSIERYDGLVRMG